MKRRIAQSLSIHQQGTLDGLCGAYAALNSMALMTRHIDTDQLFAFLVHRMGDRLAPIVLHGLTTRGLRQIVFPACVMYCAKQHIAVHYAPCRAHLDLASYWQTMQRHYARYGPGSIVLGIGGIYEHWTCIRKITDKTMMLADSSDIRRICRRHITIDDTLAPHRLNPKETFLVSMER